jgi:protein-S-isoprenylcysteine O-methyltransferase Ste14
MIFHVCFWILISLWLGFNLVTEIRLRFSRSQEVIAEHHSKYIMLLLIVAGVISALILSFRNPEHWYLPFDAVRKSALPLLLGAFILRVSAVKALNDFFSFDVQKKKDQKVVDWGPYRFVRHPAYLAELLGFSGIALAFGHFPGSLPAFFLPLCAFLYRIQIEERFMVENFGEEYKIYQGRTKKIIPFIY